MINNYNSFLYEKSISDDNVKKYGTVLQNISDIKNTTNYIKELLIKLKEDISQTQKLEIIEEETSNNKIYLLVKYGKHSKSKQYIDELMDILRESEDLDCYSTYFNIIYPDGNEIDFYPDIELEKNNLNRIHVPVGLPYILKGLGLGKKIYKSIIHRYDYLSSTSLDRSMDSIYVWNSLRKEKDIYSFVFDKKLLAISPKLEFNKIEDMLLKFYDGLSTEDIIIDDDFKDKYLKEFRKSDKISWIFDYYINQN